MSLRRSRVVTIYQDASKLPKHGASIHPGTPFLKFQTIQEAENKISHLTEREFEEGVAAGKHEMCLQCFQSIDPTSCRSVNQDWARGWHCEVCGYLKQSKEMITTFLIGAHTIHALKPSEIGKYAVHRTPWLEDSNEETGLNNFYMEIACVAQRGGTNLREALGDADFFGYPGMFDVLARGWYVERPWQLMAIRLQGIIFLRHDKEPINYTRHRDVVKENRKTTIPAPISNDDRKVMHFQLVKSQLTTASGQSHSISVLSEHSLTDDGKPIVCKRSDWTMADTVKYGSVDIRVLEKNCLGRVIRMQITDGCRQRYTYIDDKIDEWDLERTRAVLEKEPQLEQHSWDFLAETLSLIKESLDTDGDYCVITMTPNKQRGASVKGRLMVDHKGPIDANCLRDDFRRAFRI